MPSNSDYKVVHFFENQLMNFRWQIHKLMQNEPVKKIIRHWKSAKKVTCQLAPILRVTFFGFNRRHTIVQTNTKFFTTIYYGAKIRPKLLINPKKEIKIGFSRLYSQILEAYRFFLCVCVGGGISTLIVVFLLWKSAIFS